MTKRIYSDLITYINQNWEMHPYEGKKAIDIMDKSHYPLQMANAELYNNLCDLISDFAEDYDLSDSTILDEIDIERVFFDCDTIFGD